MDDFSFGPFMASLTGDAAAGPQPMAAPAAPMLSPARGFDVSQLIGPLLGIGAAIGGGPRLGGAALAGVNQMALHQQEQERLRRQEAERLAMQTQQLEMRQQQMMAAAEAKRQAAIQELVMKAAPDLASAKSKPEYDAKVNMYEQLGALQGLRPNAIRATIPYRAPDANEKLSEAATAFLKNPANKEAIEQGNLTGSMLVDVQGDGKPIPIPVTDVLKAGGVQFDPATGKPLVTPKKATAGVQLDDEAFLGEVAKFEADKGRPATQAERGEIAQRVTEDLAKKRRQGTASVVVQTGTGQADAEAIAQSIISGDQPPDLKGLYRMGPAVRASLARKGYDLRGAQSDWNATQKWIATANGQQQTRMRQAIDSVYHSLDVIEELANQWKGGKFPLLNRGKLNAALQGALGPEAQAIATKLNAQISDVTSELANVYMGGNSPTDHALDLAKRNLSSDWTESQLLAALNLARRNLQIRQNSMTNTQPVTPGTQPTMGGSDAGVEVWVRDANGKLVKKGPQ